VPIFFVVDDKEQANTLQESLQVVRAQSSNISVHQKSTGDMPTEILTFDEFLSFENESYSDIKELPLPQDMEITWGPLFFDGSKQMNVRRRYQALKKFYGIIFLAKQRSCDRVWVMDSDSLALRSFSFNDIFENGPPPVPRHEANSHEKLAECQKIVSSFSTIDKLKYSATRERFSTRRSSHQSFFGISEPYFDALTSSPCCISCFSHTHDDLWLFETRIFLHLHEHLRRVHYPRSIANLFLTWEGATNGIPYIYNAWMSMHRSDTRAGKFYNPQKLSRRLEQLASDPGLSRNASEFLKSNTGDFSNSKITHSFLGFSFADKALLAHSLNEDRQFACRGWGPACGELIQEYAQSWRVTWCLSNCEIKKVHEPLCSSDVQVDEDCRHDILELLQFAANFTT